MGRVETRNSLDKDDPKQVRVLTKALVLLEVLQDSKEELGLTEISKKAQLNKATCHRILYTFSNHNMVEPGSRPGTYRLGTRLLELGSAVQQRMDLRQLALPELTRLAKLTEETVFLCIINNDKAMCIERIAGMHVQVLSLKVGDTWPLYMGAASRSMLANLSDEKIAEILSTPIIPKTPKTPIEPEAYWKMVREIREKGYSLCYEDFTLGVASIGAPIYDHTGAVVSAISISTIVQRVSPEREKELIQLILQTTKKVSQLLGYQESSV